MGIERGVIRDRERCLVEERIDRCFGYHGGHFFNPLVDAEYAVGFPFFFRRSISVARLVLQRLVNGSCFLGFGGCVALFGLYLIRGGFVVLVLYLERSEKVATFVGIGVAVLMLVDLWTVDKRYLNDSNFIRQKPTEVYKETVADQEIMKDKDLSYRVLNLNNPFLETTTSYYHHSVGGYYAAKLRRYQELIDHRLQGELNSVIEAFQKAQIAEDLMGRSLLARP